MASNSTQRSHPQQTLTEGLAVVPQASTEVPGGTAGKDLYIFQITVVNTTAGALNYTLLDGQATPLALLPTVSLTASTTYSVVFPEGIKMLGGAKQQASGPGLVSEVFGFTHA